jgi:hypothetical protein
MIIKLKNQSPGPKGAVEPVGEKNGRETRTTKLKNKF